MIVQSDTGHARVELVAVADPQDRSFFQVTAASDGYALTNPRVFLERTSSFLDELTSFERSRQGKVVLSGTEDFQFSIEPDGRSGAIWVAIVLYKYFIAGGDRTGHAHSGRASLETGFSVAGEHVGSLLRQFRELLT